MIRNINDFVTGEIFTTANKLHEATLTKKSQRKEPEYYYPGSNAGLTAGNGASLGHYSFSADPVSAIATAIGNIFTGTGNITQGHALKKSAKLSSNYGCGTKPVCIITQNCRDKKATWQRCYDSAMANQETERDIAEGTLNLEQQKIEGQERTRKTMIIGGAILGTVVVIGTIAFAMKK